jgi:hypothetical protein
MSDPAGPEEFPMHRNPLRYSQSTCLRPAAVLVLLGAVALSGCGGGPQVRATGAWQEGGGGQKSFSRVLVVGVSPDVNQRCAFEQFMAAQIESDSVEAIVSCFAVKKREPLTRESIEEAVAAKQADAVLATILVDREWNVEEGGSRDTRGGAYYKATDAGLATGYYGVYSVPVVYGEFQTAAPVMTLTGDVQVTSKLYDTRGPTLVYTVETEAKGITTRDGGLAAVTEAIANRLRGENLIR